MVKVEKAEDITYWCEKCRWPHATRESAEACEAKEPERIYVNGPGEDWKPGDIAFKRIHCGSNTGFRLIRIDHEYESNHYIRPFWIPVDGLGPLPIRTESLSEWEGDEEDWGNYTKMHMISMGADILNEKEIQALITIADVLRLSTQTTRKKE